MMLTKKGDTFGNIICTICTRYVRCCDVVNYRFVSMEIWRELGSPTIVTSSCKKVWIMALDCTVQSSVHIFIETKPTNTLLAFRTEFSSHKLWRWCGGWQCCVYQQPGGVTESIGWANIQIRSHAKPGHAGQYTAVTPTVGDEGTQWPILSLPGVKQTCKQCLTMFGKVEYKLYLLNFPKHCHTKIMMEIT